jgi:hypothetical protein
MNDLEKEASFHWRKFIWKFVICSVADVKRPQVQLSTTARAHTKDVLIPIVIQFTEPVFLFNTSSVTLVGGNLRR